MATERIKIEKVNERKRNIEPPKRMAIDVDGKVGIGTTTTPLCAPSIFCDREEYNNQTGGKKKLNYAGCIPFNLLYKNGH